MRSIYLTVYTNTLAEMNRLGLSGRVVRGKTTVCREIEPGRREYTIEPYEHVICEIKRSLWPDDSRTVRHEINAFASKIRGLIRRYRFRECEVEVEEGDSSMYEPCYESGPSDADSGL